MERDGWEEMSEGSETKAEIRHAKMKGFRKEEFFKFSSQPDAVQRLTGSHL